MVAQGLFEVVVLANNADFFRLDDDGIDDGSEPCLARLDRPVGEPLGKRSYELFDDGGVEYRLRGKAGLKAFECGLGQVSSAAKIAEPILQRELGGVENATLNAAIEVA